MFLFVVLLMILLPSYCFAQTDTSKIRETYYVSTEDGDNRNDGLSVNTPIRNIYAIKTKKDVCIKLKAGNIFFERIVGFNNCVIESYGSGEQPVICGFKILVNTNAWEKQDAGCWQIDLSKEGNFKGYLAKDAPSELSANNIGVIYDAINDKVFGHLVQYRSDLKQEGDFCITELHRPEQIEKNPFDTLYFKYKLHPKTLGHLCFSMDGVGVTGLRNCILRDISIVGFSKHGITSCENTLIDNCNIDLIGGQNFIKERYDWWSRLGNGIEFWADSKGRNYGNTVRNCLISRCYDCGATIQGSREDIKNPTNIHFENNRFYHCRQAFEHFINPSNKSEVCYNNCSFRGNICFEMGENEMSSPDARCANIMNYEEQVRPLDISGNIFYGASHHCGYCFASGMKSNVVYVMEGQYLNHYHGKKNYQTIYANTDADIKAYKQKSGDESTIVILKSGTLKNYLARKKIKSIVNWSANVSLKKYVRDIKEKL